MKVPHNFPLQHAQKSGRAPVQKTAANLLSVCMLSASSPSTANCTGVRESTENKRLKDFKWRPEVARLHYFSKTVHHSAVTSQNASTALNKCTEKWCFRMTRIHAMGQWVAQHSPSNPVILNTKLLCSRNLWVSCLVFGHTIVHHWVWKYKITALTLTFAAQESGNSKLR